MTTTDDVVRDAIAELDLPSLAFRELLAAIAEEAATYEDPRCINVLAIRAEIRRRWSAARNDHPLAWDSHLDLDRPERTERYACDLAADGASCSKTERGHRDVAHGGR